jgi:hypothetical protein
MRVEEQRLDQLPVQQFTLEDQKYMEKSVVLKGQFFIIPEEEEEVSKLDMG